ncbi:MAG: Radical SAM protein [archaeon GW2011_AR13]|nr:MAG: Radical SAM protein [archaeon GW2011_AR13]HIG94733.1 hypothetical protein [Nanoarchaeota archaeon]HIH63699.1 hypothetical protein [Nanoarchaeota archaeon]HIJ09572.1 hypothetical protein [Nanoarchaeota archaeon]
MKALYEELPQLFSNGMYAPFAERKENVVQIELTEGCSHSKCTFCNMYNSKYKEKSLDKAKKHIDAVFNSASEKRLNQLERIWIANGDALNIETIKLNDLIQYTINEFKKYVGELPRRVALFASTKNILSHSKEGLMVLNCGGTCRNYLSLKNTCSVRKFGTKKGLDLIYWGIESGSSDVLGYVNKGCNADDIFKANESLDFSGIRKSVMIMPGLGGIRYANQHLEDTVEVLNEICPEFITLIGINPNPNSLYARKMTQEFRDKFNRPLTDEELGHQTLDILKGLNFDTKVGCFDTSMQKFGRNPYPFGSYEIDDYSLHRRDEFVGEQRKKIIK